jgi:hypothetical protein
MNQFDGELGWLPAGADLGVSRKKRGLLRVDWVETIYR